MSLTNQVAIVTGGGSGIGLGAARVLGQKGASVVLFGPDQQMLATALAALQLEKLQAHIVAGDVSSSDSVRALIEDVRSRFGRLDIIVNSAAVQPYGTVETMSEIDWDRVMAINLKGIYLTAHHGIALMRASGGGAIVNVASVQGIACQMNVAAYAASKGAALALTRAMALDHAKDNIRVNAVCPGSVDTPMLRFAASENKGAGTEDEVIRKWGQAALEKKSAEEGLVLTERQIAALERKREEQLECGEIETAHPGYLGSQDTFYVGNMKGVGRIYQQTYVDTYAKVAFAKLYTTKTPIAAADLLNDRVLPFYQEHQVPLLRVLTDRGTEYCGKVEQHDYQLYLAVNDIDHTRTKAQSPQTNGICERFHKTILNEFYQVAFRNKIYTTLESMQEDLDAWIDSYNYERTHQGKMCCGRTPMATFEDGKRICREKSIA